MVELEAMDEELFQMGTEISELEAKFSAASKMLFILMEEAGLHDDADLIAELREEEREKEICKPYKEWLKKMGWI